MEPSNDLGSLPPPPRSIRRRRGYFQFALHHLSLVFLLMFAYLFWHIAIGTVKLLWFSTIVPANVTKVLVTPGDHGPSYDILVAYQFGEAEYSEKLNIGPRDAEALKEGATVQVQVLPERPDRAHLYQESYPSVFVTIMLCLFALGPTAALAKMLWELYVAAWKLRALMRDGEAAWAVIVGRSKDSGRCPTYTVTYTYRISLQSVAGRDTSYPDTIKASMKIPKDSSPGAQVGDQVVVLYRPERPGTSVIYRYADYEFVPSALASERPAVDNPLTWRWLPVIVTAGGFVLAIGWLLGRW